MSSTTSNPAPESTTQAVAAAATDVRKDAENAGHGYLRKMLAWLKAEFAAAGLDAETELKKL